MPSVCPTSLRAKPRLRQFGCVSTMPTQAQSRWYATRVAVATTRPSPSMQKQPSGASVRRRRQSASVWFHPASFDSSSASGRSVWAKFRTADRSVINFRLVSGLPTSSARQHYGGLIVTARQCERKIYFTVFRYFSCRPETDVVNCNLTALMWASNPRGGSDLSKSV
jgi:hypothetical protein